MNEPTPIGGVGVPKCLACDNYFKEDVCKQCTLSNLREAISDGSYERGEYNG